jgi:hypothetical protein
VLRKSWIAPLLLAVAATSQPVEASSDGDDLYDDPAHWVCRPDLVDVCDSDLDATIVEADGTLTVAPFAPAADPDVDCFYVYPTISRDDGTNSDLIAAEGEEGYAARNQAAPLGTDCRVFAPTYRQVTLTALVERLSGGGGGLDQARQLAYDDVRSAWRHYLANDNGGRGVVLIGHSQGAGVLNRLIADEIEKDPEQLDILVAAYLAGSTVEIPPGAVVGGDFHLVPLCESEVQFGCVLSWASFRNTSPPPANSFFGDADPGANAACTNPASLGDGEAPLAARFPANTGASILTALGTDPDITAWVDPAVGTIDTPFVELPDLVTGRCVSWDGRHWLEVTVRGDPDDPRADDIGGDLTPEWGLHLVDINLVIGDLQRLVRTQGAAWSAAR